MSRGAIYVVTQNESYLRLLNGSVESLKRVMPELEVTVFSQFPVNCADVDHVVKIEPSDDGFYDKTRILAESPYEQTLFLDTDTFVLAPVPELFELLNQFDLAVTHEEYGNTDWSNRYPHADIPQCYPEFNTGVMVFRRSTAQARLFGQWLELYEQFRSDKPTLKIGDQPFFRVAMYFGAVRVATLTREYNCKFRGQGYLNGMVKVLHGHHKLKLEREYVEKVSAVLNASMRPRVYIGGKVFEYRIEGHLFGHRVGRKIGEFPEPPESLARLRGEELKQRLTQEGVAPFLKRVLRSYLGR